MSPLFATLLLDRDYAGLTSLTDFKFVATSLRMLRDEFNCRPQLTSHPVEHAREISSWSDCGALFANQTETDGVRMPASSDRCE
ncbi:unnamed protein product, partial [Ectocarpus fasciculatus]